MRGTAAATAAARDEGLLLGVCWMENARIVAVSEYAADDRVERKLVHA